MRKSDAQLLSELQALADAVRAHPDWCPPLETIRAVMLVPGDDRTDERLVDWILHGPPPASLALPAISPSIH